MRIGYTQQKILLLLLGGVLLGCSRSPRSYFRVLSNIRKGWKEINRRALNQAIDRLYSSKLVTAKENSDGTFTIVLTDEGKNRALTYDPDKMKLRIPEKWDQKWRMVLFDVPESKKCGRDAFSLHMRRLGFLKYQKSVFIHPARCEDEINYLIEFYGLRSHVRFALVSSLDNEIDIREHFGFL